MVNTHTLYAALFCMLTSFINAATVLAVVEVIPGPGMPSLAELGLTSADLAKPWYSINTRKLSNLESRSAAWTDSCQNFNFVNRGNALACYNYLMAIGGNACGFSGDNIIFVQAGDAAIWGSNVYNRPSVSSLCSDVALGAAWILDNCSTCGDNSCAVQGDAAANGNGDLIVSIESIYGA